MDPARLKFLRVKTTHLVLSSLPQHLALYLEIVRHEKYMLSESMVLDE